MNCTNLVEATGWVCAPTGRNALLVHAPITLGDDGQLASFYILNDTPDTFFLTDAHAAITHAIDHGARVTKSRIKKAASCHGLRHARINDDGEITASGKVDELQMSLWDALKATLTITNNESEWLPRVQQERFATKVCKTLKLMSGKEVVIKPKFKGASGHSIEFPLGMRMSNSYIRAIQTIGVTDKGLMDWGYIYQSTGKLLDLKNASESSANNRLVVVEKGSKRDEFSKAVTILSEAARVIEFSDSANFVELAAA